MNTYARQFVVNDNEGKQFICTMEGSNQSIPGKLEELSEDERRSCIQFLADFFPGLSNFEE